MRSAKLLFQQKPQGNIEKISRTKLILRWLICVTILELSLALKIDNSIEKYKIEGVSSTNAIERFSGLMIDLHPQIHV